MSDRLFSEQISIYTDSRCRAVRELIASIPCAEVEHRALDDALKRFGALEWLAEPVLELEPTSKSLDDSGDEAVYTHTVRNKDALRFSPSHYQFGGYPFKAEWEGEELALRLRADANPPAKERHAAIVKQLENNISALKDDVARHNNFIRITIETTLRERQEHCKKVAERRASL